MEDAATCERPGTTRRNANGAWFSHSERVSGVAGAAATIGAMVFQSKLLVVSNNR